MLNKTFAPLLAATALALAVPAHAGGSEDRARTAIAAAEAKIETAERLGVNANMPRQAADARAALAQAQEHFKADRNSKAVEAAIKAEALADASIGQLDQHNKQAAETNQAHVDAVANQALEAQENATVANARADAAERAAALSAAQAEAARERAATAEAENKADETNQPGR